MENPAAVPNSSIPEPKSRWKRFMKWLVLSALAVIVLLAAAGFIYNEIAQQLEARRFPQQGKSIRLGGEFGNLTLNLNCSGQGSPIVVLDSGWGIPAIGWSRVQPDVARFTRVCSYDRAGYGWSAPGPKPRTSSEIARELHALLAAAGEKSPYILVGHSFGGYNIRMFNATFTNDVAGMVLVDASSEYADAEVSKRSPEFARFLKKQEASISRQMTLAPVRIDLGIERLFGRRRDLPYLSSDENEEMRHLQLQPDFYRQAWAEMQSFSASADEVRAAGNLGDKPLIVLTGAEVVPPPPGIPKQEFDDIQNAWVNDLQVRETHLSTKGRQIILSDTGHLIPLERPDAVISAIHEVWTAAKAPTTKP